MNYKNFMRYNIIFFLLIILPFPILYICGWLGCIDYDSIMEWFHVGYSIILSILFTIIIVILSFSSLKCPHCKNNLYLENLLDVSKMSADSYMKGKSLFSFKDHYNCLSDEKIKNMKGFYNCCLKCNKLYYFEYLFFFKEEELTDENKEIFFLD